MTPSTLATVLKLFENQHHSFETVKQETTAAEITHICLDIAAMLIAKNKAYGDSALNPIRVFSKADAMEQIKVRMDDKLSRLIRGEAAGEDAITDLVGYYVLLRVAELRSLQEVEKIASRVTGAPPSMPYYTCPNCCVGFYSDAEEPTCAECGTSFKIEVQGAPP